MPRKKIVVSSNPNRPREIFELCNHHGALNKAVETLRAKYQIDVVEMRKKDKASQLKFLKVFGDKELQKDVRKILKSLKINAGNFWYVYQYVIDGNVGNMSEIERDPEGLVIEYDPKNKNDVVFCVGPKTTKTDIDEAWEMIKTWRHEGKSPRRKDKPEQERDYEIFILHLNGMTLPQICSYMDERFGKKGEWGMSETVVRKILKSFYQRFEIDIPKLQ